MKERWSTYVIVLFIVGVSLALVASFASAYHYSAGIEDNAGFSGDLETLNDRSVSLDEYLVGTDQDCGEDSTGDLQGNPLEPVNAVSSDGFCGALVYHDALPEDVPDHWSENTAFVQEVTDRWEQDAPQDQDFERTFVDEDEGFDGLRFDVQPASYVTGYTIEGTDLRSLFLGADPVYDDRREEMCKDHEEASSEDDYNCDRPTHNDARYGSGLLVPNAAQLAQQALEDEGLADYRMNGWLLPSGVQTFIAFLEDDQGPISEERLESIVAAMKGARELDGRAVPRVCGFADGFSDPAFSPHDSRYKGLPCPVTFRFVGDNGPDDPLDPDGFGDSCEGVLYACSTVGQRAWYADWVCEGYCEALDSTDAYRAWHFVAAPTISDCGGNQQPGFVTSTVGREFLAYDLDVFTPPQSEALEDGAGASSWANAALGHAQGTAQQNATPVHKTARVEANYDASQDSWNDGALVDTSQQDIVIDRDPLPWCDLLDDDAEKVNDPWVNVLDAEFKRDVSITTALGLDDATDETNNLGAYETDDEDQDRSNRPGPAYMTSGGHVAMVFDDADDGTFPLGTGSSHANFPMSSGVCFPRSTLGYGNGTGLIQAIYLPQETHFVRGFGTAPLTEDGNGEALENNVYLFFTSEMREAYHNASHEAHDAVNALVDDMTAPFTDPAGFGAGVIEVRDLWMDTYYVEEEVFEGETITVPETTVGDVTIEELEVTTLNPQSVSTPSVPNNDFSCSGVGFENGWSSYHDCTTGEMGDCEGATMVTTSMYHAIREDGALTSDTTLQGEFDISEAFDPTGDGLFDFCSEAAPDRFNLMQPGEGCIRAWMDVDPIDNDPLRNIQDPMQWSPLRYDPAFE